MRPIFFLTLMSVFQEESTQLSTKQLEISELAFDIEWILYGNTQLVAAWLENNGGNKILSWQYSHNSDMKMLELWINKGGLSKSNAMLQDDPNMLSMIDFFIKKYKFVNDAAQSEEDSYLSDPVSFSAIFENLKQDHARRDYNVILSVAPDHSNFRVLNF